MLVSFSVASTERCKDAGSVQSHRYGRDRGRRGAPRDRGREARARCPGAHLVRALLGAVLRAGLLAVGDAARVERGADDLVAEARQVLDAAAADEHDRVLLEVVALARDVRADLH